MWGNATVLRMIKAKETFGQRVRRLRKEKGTQVTVAADLGISRAHLAKMETGGDMPGRETLQAMSTLFGVTMDYLQTGEHPAPADRADDPDYNADKLRMDAIWEKFLPVERKFVLDQFEGLAARRAKVLKRPARRR